MAWVQIGLHVERVGDVVVSVESVGLWLSPNRCGIRAVVCAAALAMLAACATPPPADDKEGLAAYEEANDPWEPFNRAMFEFNRGLDRAIIRPVAETYRDVVPAEMRSGVHNIVNNLRTPNIFVNDLLQGELARAGDSALRLTVNSLAGLGGTMDVMAMESEGSSPIEYHGEDFGQTLAVWGLGEGPYLMLPLLGPSSPRAVTGKVGDIFLDPLSYLIPDAATPYFGIARFLADGIDRRSRNIETIDEIERTSIDFYATVRSLYRQQRKAEIANGAEMEMEVPILSIDFDEDVEREKQAAKRN